MKRQLRKGRLALAVGLSVLIITILMNIWPLLFMRTLATGRIPGTEIYSIDGGQSNLFLLQTEEGWLAIDGGASQKRVENALERLGLNPASVTQLLLTHSDSDHLAALTIFLDAQIYLAEAEMPLLDGSQKRNTFTRNALPKGVDQSRLTLLIEGEVLNFGDHRVEVLALPGHTPGSSGYLVDDKYLFSGDATRVSGGKLRIHPYTMERKQAGESLVLLRDLQSKNLLLLTAHYGYYQLKELQ